MTGIGWGEGLVLRYGGFYGPGTSLSLETGGGHGGADPPTAVPLIGDGGGVWSFVHIEDAATATAAAVERGRAGIHQIVDDEPAPVRDWPRRWPRRWTPSRPAPAALAEPAAGR